MYLGLKFVQRRKKPRTRLFVLVPISKLLILGVFAEGLESVQINLSFQEPELAEPIHDILWTVVGQ
jgi:hypothetical protein